MPVQRYERKIYCEAIQFVGIDPMHIQEIIAFVGLPISIEYGTDGDIRLRVIRGALDVLVVPLNDYIIMHENGRLDVMSKTEFEGKYQLAE